MALHGRDDIDVLRLHGLQDLVERQGRAARQASKEASNHMHRVLVLLTMTPPATPAAATATLITVLTCTCRLRASIQQAVGYT